MTDIKTMKDINPEIEDMILHKKLSPRKIRNLIEIKNMVERLSSKNYLSAEEVADLEKKFHVAPDIITWGDYFQTEIASQHWEKEDAEFEKITQTIEFDLIAATMIFHDKPENFFRVAEQNKYEAMGKNPSEWTPRDEENYHLGILYDYYRQMGLSFARLSARDFEYFEQFADKKAI